MQNEVHYSNWASKHKVIETKVNDNLATSIDEKRNFKISQGF
jgi:hypothetical protein